jgi:putative two-component system response regulator
VPSKVILVVDDDELQRLLLRELLEDRGYAVELAKDGLEALAKLELGVDLVLLDLILPGMDGFEVVRRIRESARHRALPVIMITGLAGREQRRAAIRAGADDFVGRPFDATELQVRVQAQLRLREAQALLDGQQLSLEEEVEQRTRQLRRSIDEAVAAQRQAWRAHLDTIHRLVLACEYKDHHTGTHAQRMAEYCGLLAQACNLPPGDVELLRHASPMHDVGKMGIPDSILLKPGPLTVEERRIMEQHTVIGAHILGGSTSRLLQAGEVIALTHHEHWDGTGYPRRLTGPAIPLWGRICAVADFFDAMTSDRRYRSALSIGDAFELLAVGRGTQFDPHVTDVFLGIRDRVREIRETLRGEAA